MKLIIKFKTIIALLSVAFQLNGINISEIDIPVPALPTSETNNQNIFDNIEVPLIEFDPEITNLPLPNFSDNMKSVWEEKKRLAEEIFFGTLILAESKKKDLEQKNRKFKLPRAECPHCGKELSKLSMQRHVQTHATNKKLFSCNICGLSTHQKSNLTRHMLVHTQEFPFSCNTCKRKFKRKHYLKRHAEKCLLQKNAQEEKKN